MHVDLIKQAERLEAIAAELRAEASRDKSTGQLPLVERPWSDWSGGKNPYTNKSAVVDYRTKGMVARADSFDTAPALALIWRHYDNAGDIVQHRLAAEQPAK